MLYEPIRAESERMDDEFLIVTLIDIIFNEYCFSTEKSLSFHLPNNFDYSTQYRFSFNSLLHMQRIELRMRCSSSSSRVYCALIFLKNSQYPRLVKKLSLLVSIVHSRISISASFRGYFRMPPKRQGCRAESLLASPTASGCLVFAIGLRRIAARAFGGCCQSAFGSSGV